MSFFLRGALVEYGRDVLGPIPNIVVFQFNPEQISRTLNMPREKKESSNPEKAKGKEDNQISAPPVESFSIKAQFSAADDLGKGGAVSIIPRVFGIGPQLAALEKMAYPSAGLLSGAKGAIIDAVGDDLGLGSNSEAPEQPTPREEMPRILFVWGLSRVLPVKIETMSIVEQKYDPLLNPIQAEVDIGLAIAMIENSKEDPVGYGALKYTQIVKDTQAVLNLAKAGELAVNIIPF